MKLSMYVSIKNQNQMRIQTRFDHVVFSFKDLSDSDDMMLGLIHAWITVKPDVKKWIIKFHAPWFELKLSF